MSEDSEAYYEPINLYEERVDRHEQHKNILKRYRKSAS